ncbi:MAG: hypothetical protein GY754_03680 [bacterium]|nr:hypothetical protein [bacterium]
MAGTTFNIWELPVKKCIIMGDAAISRGRHQGIPEYNDGYIHNVSREEYYLFPLGHSSVIIAPRSGIHAGTTGGVSHYDVLECQGQDNTGGEIKIDVAKQIEGDDCYKEFYLMRYWDKTNTM